MNLVRVRSHDLAALIRRELLSEVSLAVGICIHIPSKKLSSYTRYALFAELDQTYRMHLSHLLHVFRKSFVRYQMTDWHISKYPKTARVSFIPLQTPRRSDIRLDRDECMPLVSIRWSKKASCSSWRSRIIMDGPYSEVMVSTCKLAVLVVDCPAWSWNWSVSEPEVLFNKWLCVLWYIIGMVPEFLTSQTSWCMARIHSTPARLYMRCPYFWQFQGAARALEVGS